MRFTYALVATIFVTNTTALVGQQRPENIPRIFRGDFFLFELGEATTTYAVAFSPSNKYLVTAGSSTRDKKYLVFLWDIEQKRLMTKSTTNLKFFVEKLDYAPDEKSILAVDYLGNVNILSAKGELISNFKLFELYRNNITDIKFADHDTVLTLNAEGIASTRTIKNHDTKLFHISQNRLLFGTISYDRRVCAWADENLIYIWKNALTATPGITAISKFEKGQRRAVLSDNGSQLLCATDNSKMTLYEVETKKSTTWEGDLSPVSCLIALRKGMGFVSGHGGGVIKVWSSTGKLLATLQHSESDICSLAVNADNTLLVAGRYKNTLVVWDLEKILKGAQTNNK